MNEVSRILDAIGQGDAWTAAQLLPLVYDELRRLAAERMSQETAGDIGGAPKIWDVATGRGLCTTELKNGNLPHRLISAGEMTLRICDATPAQEEWLINQASDTTRTRVCDAPSYCRLSGKRLERERSFGPRSHALEHNALEHNHDEPQGLVSEVPQISFVPFPALRPSSDQGVCLGHPLLLPVDSEW